MVYKLNNRNDYVRSASVCDLQTFYKFNFNGTAEITSYVEGKCSCIQEADNLSSFNCGKVNNNNYRLFSIEIDGTQNSHVNTVIFESENVMYWIDNFSDGFIIGGELYNET